LYLRRHKHSDQPLQNAFEPSPQLDAHVWAFERSGNISMCPHCSQAQAPLAVSGAFFGSLQAAFHCAEFALGCAAIIGCANRGAQQTAAVQMCHA
jgi:hypothetical protein